jgi:hypothetical protein
VSHWVQFINAFNETAEQTVGPHFQVFADTCTTLIGQLGKLWDLLECGAMKSGVSRRFFEKLQSDATGLKKEALFLSRMSRDVRAKNFNPADFDHGIGVLARGIGRVFVRAEPRCTMATGEVMYSRTCLNASCNDLVRISRAIASFEALAARVRSTIARTSVILDGLFTQLGVPLGIKLHFDEEEEQVEIARMPRARYDRPNSEQRESAPETGTPEKELPDTEPTSETDESGDLDD